MNYLICYKSKVDNLKTQVKELRGARNRLLDDVDTAIRNLKKIEDDVERRLTESNDIIQVAEKILEADNRGWYLNMKSRYKVSKRAHKAASEAKNLKDKISKISSVGYRESAQVVEAVTSNIGYEAFESRMPTITGVLEALTDDNITRIGIHGMGGIGKTMLVKEVLKQAKKDKLFDKYLFLVVSIDPDLKKIQTEIAEQLDLILDKESELARRDQLHKRLKQENRILIILDDIWKYLDLEALGIFSFGDDNKGCKLMLTSRFYNVVCNDMDTQKQFKVEVFLKDEARNLFEKIVGDLAKTSEIKPTMLQIIEECAGLPIAITTVAKALKNRKNPRIWKNFHNQLKMSSPRELEGMNEVYKSIKMSYEFLESNEAQSLLLLCSLHGEDDDIEVEDLLRYGVGLGLFDNVDTIEGARCRVHSLVERLKDSSLLLDGDHNGTVKMHHVIRGVVINIAVEEKHMYTIRTVNELQTRSKGKDTVAISLPYINDDLDLPHQFECSKLELLLLFRQKVGFRIPDSFFVGLRDLKVLKLSRSWSEELPLSLSHLRNLQTLCLDGGVQNATIIGDLKNLKALSLSLYYTERLPKEIGFLPHLQLLDLGECSKLKFIPPNVLSNLKRLEELYLPNYVEWEVEAQSTERINAMVSELDHLSHLTKLHICIENAKILPNAMVFERLESYRIAIGSAWLRGETLKTSRILKLKISFQSDHGYKVLFRRCETLILDEMKGVKNNLHELDSEGFQSLKHLTVQHNDKIQYIFKSMGVLDCVFPSLESITLWNVNNLEWICYTRLPTKTFCNLRVVKVRNCCKLEFVFSSSMGGCFSHLQEIFIEDCQIVSAIVAIDTEKEIEVDSDYNIMFANLHSLKLRNLLKLKGFLSVADSLVLLNGKVVFPNLEELEIKGICSMKMIWSNQLISDCFGKLEIMSISGCTNLTNIVPSNMLRTLRNLKELKICDCDSLEEVYEIQWTNNVEESCDIATAELISLTLTNLEKVKHVWSMDPQGIITFPKLRTIKIEGCSNLKSVFPTSVAKALLQLERLTIWDCASVEEIVAKEGIETASLFVFPRLTTLELYKLPELKSFYPGNHTLEWPSLNHLSITGCDKLKIFGSTKSSDQETTGLAHHANLIQQPLFFIEKGDGDVDLNATIKENWEAKLETCDQKFAEEAFSAEEGNEKQILLLPQRMVFDTEAVEMISNSSKRTKSEIEVIEDEASQRWPEGLQVEEMQQEAISTLKCPGEFDVEAVKMPESSGQMKFQIADKEMEPEADRPQEAQQFLMQVGLRLTEPPKDEDWENANEIYLMDNELSVLPENPRCPKLSALFLQRNYKLRLIPPSFFDRMPALQTLNLSGTKIKSLPNSIFRLDSLKRLFLNDCHCFMVLSPEIGKLKQLEVLSLEGTEIMDLPPDIKKLTNLTCLEVSFCECQSNCRQAMQLNAVVPCGVISVLSQLVELDINVDPDDERWDACVEAIVNEVCTLKRLYSLKFYFQKVELLSHIQQNIPSLLYFRFTVGRHLKRIMSGVPRDVEFEMERWDRCLKYINGVDVPRDIKKVLQHATAFFLDRHATVKKLSNFGIQNMERLKCLVMGECSEVQVIIDEADGYEEDDSDEIVSESYGTEKIVLGSLEYMYVYYMESLRSMWEGPGPLQPESLFCLKSLTLCTCPQLTTIFTPGLLANLCNLEELKVDDCPSIKSIVSHDITAEHKISYFLPELKKISLHYMPELVSISNGLHIAPKLEWLSFYDCPKLKNPLVGEISTQCLKGIKGEMSWWKALDWSNGRPAHLDEIFVLIDIGDC